MSDLPTGTVTFLFTDIEDSTRLWDEHSEEMRHALARHDVLLTECIERSGGLVVKHTGDGFMAVFSGAEGWVRCALAAQRALWAERWDPAVAAVRVRMALNSGTAELRGEDYYGSVVNRTARIEAAAHGGQIFLSN